MQSVTFLFYKNAICYGKLYDERWIIERKRNVPNE